MSKNTELVTLIISQGAVSTKHSINKLIFQQFLHHKIGDELEIQLQGNLKKLVITGASTDTGTPLYSAVPFNGYKKVHYKQNIKKGIQKKLRVHGNYINQNVRSIDTKVRT